MTEGVTAGGRIKFHMSSAVTTGIISTIIIMLVASFSKLLYGTVLCRSVIYRKVREWHLSLSLQYKLKAFVTCSITG